MRSRTTAAVLPGALALAAFGVPSAEAGADTLSAASGRAGAPAVNESVPPTVWDVVVNGGEPVVLGTHAAKKVTVTFRASHAEGIFDASTVLWYGTSPEEKEARIPADGLVTACTSGTTVSCTADVTIAPRTHLERNAFAGAAWKAELSVVANGGDEVELPAARTFSVQRAARLTVNASPEPVRQGKVITVTGALTRADWETYKYSGYSGQSVKLQFRKAGTDAYTTLGTVRTDSRGQLSTTLTAESDGYFRYSFVSTPTTQGVNATGDYVDVV
ncbi:hypothetical protein [Streptomyces clavuligerus]|nr:hypothetical protein [Streptomyces clavuligerus]WDN53130.1 hypothetical protein LL058_15490 [Streptomyces clavuligerus]